jgi:hypothetical protein
MGGAGLLNEMTRRRALALAVMALADVGGRCPGEMDWKQAEYVIRGMLKEARRRETMDTKDQAYAAALELVKWIELRLWRQRIIRDRNGRRLDRVEDVVQAILDDRLEVRDGGVL